MPYVKPEAIIKARQMDVLTYLKTFEPQELVKFSKDTYTTKTHDSLKISNGKWYWWSRGIGGHSALDYLINVKGYSFVQAVETIVGSSAVVPIEPSKPKEKEMKVLRLPEKSSDTSRITEYLFHRGIDYEIIHYCIQKGLIFESLPKHNVVFLGADEKGKARYAAYRATNKSNYKGDASGSDKRYSFRLETKNNTIVHLFECAIDTLSYATLLKMNGRGWKQENLVSLAGVYANQKQIKDSKVPLAVEGFLKMHPEIERIEIHFDNDKVGRKASQSLQYHLGNRFEIVDNPPPFGKDYNDFLCYKLGITIPKERRYER